VAFLRGARSHEETFPLGIDFFETVVRGIREGYTTQELEGILRIIEEEVLVKVASPPLRPETLRLSDKEMRVLQAVQGQHTLQTLTTSLAGTFGLDVADVYAAVFLGLSCQWLDAPGWSRNLSKSEILR
jgi:hypothetical protein